MPQILVCCACRAVGSEVELPCMHKSLLIFGLFDKITHGHILILLIPASICTGGTGTTGSQGYHRRGYNLSPIALLQHRITSDQISEQMQLLCSPRKNERSRVGMHTTERKTINENLLSTCSSLCPRFFFPKEKTAFVREEKKTQQHSTKPRWRSRHSHLGCSSSAGALPSLLRPTSGRDGGEDGPGGRLLELTPQPPALCKTGRLPLCSPAGPAAWAVLPSPPAPGAAAPVLTHTCTQVGLRPPSDGAHNPSACLVLGLGAERQSPFWPTCLALPGSSFVSKPQSFPPGKCIRLWWGQHHFIQSNGTELCQEPQKGSFLLSSPQPRREKI